MLDWNVIFPVKLMAIPCNSLLVLYAIKAGRFVEKWGSLIILSFIFSIQLMDLLYLASQC
jgi:hypothetical protein